MADKTTEVHSEPKPILSLTQRLQLVGATVGRVAPTGLPSQATGNRPALTIGDIEDAVRDALVQHGVITLWGDENEPYRTDDGQTQYGKQMWMWSRTLRYTFINADDKEDTLTGIWFDTGGNPMAAASFARKGVYKSLFHISEDNDEGSPSNQQAAAPQVAAPRFSAPGTGTVPPHAASPQPVPGQVQFSNVAAAAASAPVAPVSSGRPLTVRDVSNQFEALKGTAGDGSRWGVVKQYGWVAGKHMNLLNVLSVLDPTQLAECFNQLCALENPAPQAGAPAAKAGWSPPDDDTFNQYDPNLDGPPGYDPAEQASLYVTKP